MSETLPTVKIKHKVFGYEMIINVEDFDGKVHEELKSKVRNANVGVEAPKTERQE